MGYLTGVLVVPDLVPRLHPIVATADNFERLDNFDAVAPAEAVGRVDGGQVDGDRRRPRGDLRLDSTQFLQCLFRTRLDHAPRAHRGNLSRRVA